MSVLDDLRHGTAQLKFDRKEQRLNLEASRAVANLVLNVLAQEYLRRITMTQGIQKILANYESFYHEAVRRGGTALGEGNLVDENPDWVKFARVMMPIMHMPAEMMAGEVRKRGEVSKVLDIAAGHGIFGIAVAKQNPSAHIYAADWKNVLEVATQNAQAMGVADRHHG